MNEAIFYKEWIPLPKAEFNVLAMIAEQGGSFSGNYADMCRYLGVDPQSRNRAVLRTAIGSLVSQGFISCESRGRTHHLTAIPKATEIRLPRLWVQSVIRHDYSSESVAFAFVLKVFVNEQMPVAAVHVIVAEKFLEFLHVDIFLPLIGQIG